MTYMDRSFRTRANAQPSEIRQMPREMVVVVVEDDVRLSEVFRSVCDCLDIAVERVATRDDLGAALRKHSPMAVVAEIDAPGQDGCNVLMTIAAYDQELPVLVLTSDEPALLGAVDAVEEIWELSSVDKWPELLGVGAVVDFLFRAGRKGGCLRLMSV
jgi:CheY-like chemotaxis protein